MPNTLFASTQEHNRDKLQAYVLLGFGLIFLLGALFLHTNPFALPVGLLFFGLAMLISAALNPSKLAIAGIMYTLIGAVIFNAFKPIIPYDSSLAIIAIGLALLIIAFLARQGYIGTGALTPGLLVLIVGLLLYQPTGRAASKWLAPFVLSLWFPAVMLLLIGLVYWLRSVRNA